MQTVAGWLRRSAAAVLQMGPVPRHVAFIMDGNRRFAERLQLESFRGHSRGYDKVRTPCIVMRPLCAVKQSAACCSQRPLRLRI